jgi:hypothetical protein
MSKNYSVIAAQLADYFSLQGHIEHDSGDIVVPPISVNIDGLGYHKATDTTLDPSTDNDGSFASLAVGTDYYIYAMKAASDSIEPQLTISENSTYPDGSTADDSRKIGGFHYGRVRVINAKNEPINGDEDVFTTGGSVAPADWQDNVAAGIVPLSVWSLKHRPRCTPEGMVYMGGGLWVDIYLASDDGAGGVKSAYNATPITGTEGLNQYDFMQRFARVDKRGLTYAEWCNAAFGSPQGEDGNNDHAYAKTTNSARAATGSVEDAVSSIGCVDCVGNVWEWLDETNVRSLTAATGAWKDVITTGEYAAVGWGQAYMYDDNHLVALRAGGDWTDGVNAGARAVALSHQLRGISVINGSRAACESI